MEYLKSLECLSQYYYKTSQCIKVIFPSESAFTLR